MAETDILNPVRGFWPTLNDNPNPSYGYTRRSASNSALAKVRMGAPYSRDTMNQGFAFEFNYVERPRSTILRLKHFYEQFKNGYFTYIDWDGGGRHHVGRFTTPVNAMEIANGKYTVQGLLFEEMPRARMLEYPADFTNWSRCINVLDDYLQPTVANYNALPGSWTAQLDPTLVGPSATDPSAYEMFDGTPSFYSTSPNNYDWAQMQYVGWGFQLKFRTGAALGQVALYIDGVYISGVYDLSTGTRVADGSGYLPALPAGMTYVGGILTATNMPLDLHRVKLAAYQASGGMGIIFPKIKVIV